MRGRGVRAGAWTERAGRYAGVMCELVRDWGKHAGARAGSVGWCGAGRAGWYAGGAFGLMRGRSVRAGGLACEGWCAGVA